MKKVLLLASMAMVYSAHAMTPKKVNLTDAVFTLADNDGLRCFGAVLLVNKCLSDYKFTNNVAFNTGIAIGSVVGAVLVPRLFAAFTARIPDESGNPSEMLEPNSSRNKVLLSPWTQLVTKCGLTVTAAIGANGIPLIASFAKWVGSCGAKVYGAAGDFIVQNKLTTIGLGIATTEGTKWALKDAKASKK